MSTQAVYVYSDKLLTYKFHQHHPFNQKRLQLTLDLLQKMKAISHEHIIPPRMATDEDLTLFHDISLIDTVKKASKQLLTREQALQFGLGTEDTPIFPNMHEASSLIVGGTLTAVDSVMEKRSKYALHLGGGLHHGFQRRVSGFCIYNDCAIALKYIRQKYQARVLYIDTDAHHGDGVQWAFYDDPNVCTLSIHETGRYLFPGTGNTYERGSGLGYGYSFNIPLDAFTEDESWLEIYRNAVIKVAEYFKPDVILTQNGADAHYYDPLTHLSTTMNIYYEIPKLAKQIADAYCDGRWIAVGGGGYDIWRVVPRAWSLIWLYMTEQEAKASGALPLAWIKNWQKEAPVELPSKWKDPDHLYPAIPRKKEIEEKNLRSLANAMQMIQNV
jgi:acetoin utilization protein AcuC